MRGPSSPAATPSARPPPPPPRRTGGRPPTSQVFIEELSRELSGPEDEPLDELVAAETIAVREKRKRRERERLSHR